MRPEGRVVVDSGALSALATGGPDVRCAFDRAIEKDVEVVIPAVVLAESTVGSGPRDAAVNRIVAMVNRVAPADEDTARRAGRLRHAARSTHTIDALIAAEACRDDVPTVILTAEKRTSHFRDLTEGHPHVRVVIV